MIDLNLQSWIVHNALKRWFSTGRWQPKTGSWTTFSGLPAFAIIEEDTQTIAINVNWAWCSIGTTQASYIEH